MQYLLRTCGVWVGVALILVCFVLPAEAAVTCVTITHDLSLESTDATTGGDVSKLQMYLSQVIDIYRDGAVTGYFDPDTRLAVYRWQKASGVVPKDPAQQGYVDAKTRLALKNCSARTLPLTSSIRHSSTATNVSYSNGCPILSRNLSRGNSGVDVKALQQFLVGRGLLASDSTTGFFGALTELSVQKWQAQSGIVSSGSPSTTGYGSTGPRTRSSIAGNCSTNTLTSGSTNTTASSVTCPASVVPPSCQTGYKPGGSCNSVCVADPNTSQSGIGQNSGSQTQTNQNMQAIQTAQTTQIQSNTNAQASPGTTITAVVLNDTARTVQLSGTYSSSAACSAQWNLGYGDETSESLPSACTSTTFSYTYTYANPGIYDAYVDKITGPDDALDFETQAQIRITIDADDSVQISQVPLDTTMRNTLDNLASALVGLTSFLHFLSEEAN